MKQKAYKLAAMMEEMPRGPEDLETARVLRRLADCYEVAREVVIAKTHERSSAAYAQLVDFFKGKPDN